MNKLPPFFVIGTIGLLVTAALHMGMSLILGIEGVHGVFAGLYPVFIAMLLIGTWRLRPIKVRSRR